MPNITDSINKAVKTELDEVAKNKLVAEVGTDGHLTGNISTIRKGFTITAYVKALVTGKKNFGAGVRVEKTF
jgi:hypothetical protein